jgi:MFS family permease
MLDLFRALQGLGAAFVFPSCTAVLAHEFRGAERAKVFGILGSVLGIGLALGPLLGGVLTSWLGWRAIFLVNVPIGFGVLALAIPKMSESSDPSATRVDWFGLVTFTLSLFLFTSALIEASSLGWGSPRIVGALLGAGVLIAFFVIAERLQHRPMFDLGLFRNPSFVAAQILSIAFSSIFVTLEVYLPLYFQGVRGTQPYRLG